MASASSSIIAQDCLTFQYTEKGEKNRLLKIWGLNFQVYAKYNPKFPIAASATASDVFFPFFSSLANITHKFYLGLSWRKAIKGSERERKGKRGNEHLRIVRCEASQQRQSRKREQRRKKGGRRADQKEGNRKESSKVTDETKAEKRNNKRTKVLGVRTLSITQMG